MYHLLTISQFHPLFKKTTVNKMFSDHNYQITIQELSFKKSKSACLLGTILDLLSGPQNNLIYEIMT